MSEHEDLRELGNQLPWHWPDAARRDAVRSALLAAATTGGVRSRSRWLALGGAFVAGAAAAAAIALLVPHDEAGQPRADRAQIEASTAADFERDVTATADGTDEVVRVHGGTIRVAVADHAPGDRVRVATGDAEVEGEGRYAVAVAGDVLREVVVEHGHAAVHVRGQQPVFLATGETWRPAVSVAEIAGGHAAPAPEVAPPPPPRKPSAPPTHVAVRSPEPAPEPVAAPAPEPIAAPAPPAETGSAHAEPSATEHHFETGWQLLRSGKAAEAARELGAAADAGGDAPLAADARYFQAIALTRAGRKTEAEHALVAFLDHAPHSLRRGRAAVMLARLIAERGDATAARAWFEAALGDPDPAVADSARAGLASLAH